MAIVSHLPGNTHLPPLSNPLANARPLSVIFQVTPTYLPLSNPPADARPLSEVTSRSWKVSQCPMESVVRKWFSRKMKFLYVGLGKDVLLLILYQYQLHA